MAELYLSEMGKRFVWDIEMCNLEARLILSIIKDRLKAGDGVVSDGMLYFLFGPILTVALKTNGIAKMRRVFENTKMLAEYKSPVTPTSEKANEAPESRGNSICEGLFAHNLAVAKADLSLVVPIHAMLIEMYYLLQCDQLVIPLLDSISRYVENGLFFPFAYG